MHLITYASPMFAHSASALREEARATGWFETVTVYSPSDLDAEFRQRFGDILSRPRGGGYWIWKIHCIEKRLRELSYGDILVYLDAGCVLNARGHARLAEYRDMIIGGRDHSIAFQLTDLVENRYTTREVLRFFNVEHDPAVTHTGQLVGGIRMMRKTPQSVQCVQSELACLYANPLLFTDVYNHTQPPPFIDHRHDQSVYSVLRKRHCEGTVLLPDETWYPDFRCAEAQSKPFWAMRRRLQ